MRRYRVIFCDGARLEKKEWSDTPLRQSLSIHYAERILIQEYHAPVSHHATYSFTSVKGGIPIIQGTFLLF